MFVNSISNRLITLGKVLFSFAIQKTTEVVNYFSYIFSHLYNILMQAYAAQTLEAVTAMPAQQPVPPSGMHYPPQSADAYPPQSADAYPPQSADAYPPQSADAYPPQSADAYPPTYSDVIYTDPTKQKEFSDEEDFGKTANPIGQWMCILISIIDYGYQRV